MTFMSVATAVTTAIPFELQSDNELVGRYAKLVKRIAYHLVGRMPACVLVDDLVQSGMIGLLEAAHHYDENKGASFETYASIRIRGAMLDEVRKSDWVPRSVHRNSRKIADAVRRIEHETGADAREPDIAKALDLPLKEYQHMLVDTSSTHVYGFEDLGLSDDDVNIRIASQLPEPYDCLQENDFKTALATQIALLPERERSVIALYYDEELTLREIGEMLGVTESRVCQIHAQAMVRLRARMHDWYGQIED